LNNVDLFSNRFSVCIMEIPGLIELRKTVGEDKLAILAISNEKPGFGEKVRRPAKD